MSDSGAEPSDKDEEDLAAIFADMESDFEQAKEAAVVPGSEGVSCPVCKTHDLDDVLQSDALVITGVEAMLAGNSDTTIALYRQFTQYDAHRAVTMLASLVRVVCAMSRTSPAEFIKYQREELNEALAAHLARSSETTDGTGAEGDPGN